MNDAEYIFHETSKSAKRLARSAFSKKGGSRSKRCSLPSDKLTPKQLRERNGKVMSYNLNKPMDWKTFQSLDDETQRQYLYKLANFKHARCKDVAEMFGLNRNYFNQWVTARKGWAGIFPHTGRRTPHSEWLAFLRSGEPEAENVPEPVEEPESPQTPPERVKQAPEEASAIAGCVTYVGLPASIFERAYQLCDPNKGYRVTITFALAGDKEAPKEEEKPVDPEKEPEYEWDDVRNPDAWEGF